MIRRRISYSIAMTHKEDPPKFLKLGHILIPLFFSILYIQIPWPEIYLDIHNYPLMDRQNYLDTVFYYAKPTQGVDFTNIMRLFTDEFIWRYIIWWISFSFTMDPETAVLLISFFLIFVFSYELNRSLGAWGLLLLFNPLVVDFAFSQLRLALAIAILGMLHIVQPRSRLIVITTLIATTMIHTASILFFGMYFLARLGLSNRNSVQRFTTVIRLMLGGFIVGALIGPLRQTILEALEDRRSDYIDMSSSLIYISYWLLLLFLLIFDWRRSLKTIEVRMSITILSLILINVFTGGYSSRFIAATFPFLAISAQRALGRDRILSVAPFLLYVVFQWYGWLRPS